MKDQETIARFVHLRAQGLSFARIASELNVSKPTLITWSRQFQFEIQNLRSVETEALAEKCFTGRQQRWEHLGEQLSRIEEELAKRTLDTIPTARLITLASRLRREINHETGQTRFSTAVRNLPNDERVDEILDWQV